MSNLPILEIENLTHTFPHGNGGIFDISFSVSSGEFIVLAGKNGSGKTTLIRHLNGLLRPQSGKILLHQENIFNNLTRTRKSVGMVFQDADTQILGDTVFDEVAFGPENLNLPRHLIREKVTQVLEELDLIQFRDRNPATLSGGEKRRVTIAGILVMDPEIIVFDEPFANLDYPSVHSLLAFMEAMIKKGQTLIMASHDVETTIELAPRLILMEKGVLKEDGPALDLVKKLDSYGVKEPCLCKMEKTDPWQP